jgi:hypothetical protein
MLESHYDINSTASHQLRTRMSWSGNREENLRRYLALKVAEESAQSLNEIIWFMKLKYFLFLFTSFCTFFSLFVSPIPLASVMLSQKVSLILVRDSTN